MKLDKPDHRSLVLWATACAEHVLPYFEVNYPKDNRPRKALEAGRAWVRSEVAVSEVRAAALAARAASRAAGHAAATADVGTHAAHAANCAVTAATAATADPTDSAAAAAKERDWQYRRLPKHFRLVAFLA
jgi:hypothetical protein